MQKPVILLAFANERQQGARYLRNLPLEANGIKEILSLAEERGLCEYEILHNATLDMVVNAFQSQKYRGRIALFHYGGHAGSYELLLEEAGGKTRAAIGDGLAPFLAGQDSLKLVFLNGCLTSKLAAELNRQGVPAVIGTVTSVLDRIATDIALSFYRALANGIFLEQAWEEAIYKIKAREGQNGLDRFYEPGEAKREDVPLKSRHAQFPWVLSFREGEEEARNWNLPDEAGNPLFGLPDIAHKFDLPNEPYRFLKPYQREDARIFFGRSHYIRELYHRLASPLTSPVVLLHGQSGVGKSSLLDAGLRPRLEAEMEVRYARRNPEHGLSRDLKQALGLPGEAGGPELLKAWQKIEEEKEKNLIIILDQAEEAFTRPATAEPDELDNLLRLAKDIFNDPTDRPRGKLLLSYRKEYHPDIDAAVVGHSIPREAVFLSKLGREGIEEIVKGLASTPAHQRKYGLTVEPGLPAAIATDLLKDADSPITPVLQIILTKLWNKSAGEGEQKGERRQTKGERSRTLSVENYHKLQEEGILLDDFFSQQMAAIKKWEEIIRRKVESSGLALDILHYHTTPYGTAESRGLEAVRSEYRHQSEILDELIQHFKSLYLLSDAGGGKTALAHDTLAPVIQKRVKDSNKPGQRALRILETKMADYERRPGQTVIDEDDLALVEQGASGMRIWRKKEEELIEKSRKRRAALEAERRRNRVFRRRAVRAIGIFGVLAAVFALVTTFLWQKSQKEADVSALVSEALETERTDPTAALEIAGKALELLPAHEIALQARHDIYSNNEFYERVIRHPAPVLATSISPGGKLIAAASGNKVFLWSRDGTLQDTLPHAGPVLALAFSPDGNYLVTGSKDNAAHLWSIAGQEVRQFTHSDWVNAVAFSPGGQYILAGGRDNQAILSSIEGKEAIRLAGHEGEVQSVAFSPSGDTLLTGSWDGKARLWDKEGNLLKVLSGHEDRILSAVFAPGGEQVLTSSRDATAAVWDLDGNITARLAGHQYRVNAARWLGTGEYILTAGDDYRIKLWDRKGRPIREYRGHSDHVNDIAASADGRWFVSAGADSTLRVWRVESKVKTYLGPHENEVSSLAFSTDGDYIFTASGSGAQQAVDAISDPTWDFDFGDFEGSAPQNAYLWDKDGNLLATFEGHQEAITSVAVSPDGQRFLTGGEDDIAILWNRGGDTLQRFRHAGDVQSVAFSPSGNEVLTAGSDSMAIRWSLDGKHLAVFEGHGGLVSAVAFSPDGQTILTACFDDTLRLFSRQGELLRR
ncbi:MAG: hypothetical protein J5I98_17045, partial [Phaeodactylibacter sp.]|nr:hypothetical protein [Phaeodactylibacter sp.]